MNKMASRDAQNPDVLPNKQDNYGEYGSHSEALALLKALRKRLEDNKQDLEVQRQDPDSPLHSIKTFEALSLKAPLLKGIYAMGYNAPSKIQETALPIMLADPPQNLIAQSQSGTGKTAALILAMLSRVDPTKNYPQVLCMLPTYELAIQFGEVTTRMGYFCPEIKIKFAVRGEEVRSGTELSEHIVIGTPGKVLDWSVMKSVIDLKKIRLFVLDEADLMISLQGHHEQCMIIHKEISKKCQMLLFSATYDKAVMDFAQHIVPNPNVITVKREHECIDNIKQYYVLCRDKDQKYIAIQNIYGGITIGQAIIFCQSRESAAWLASKLSYDGHSLVALSGDMNNDQRLSVLDRFRAGLEKVLITTNVLLRGIDVEQVTLVINFDLPMDKRGKVDYNTYLHRIGRTGRFGKHGIAVNLISGDKSMAMCELIERRFKKPIMKLDTNEPKEIEKMA